LYEPVGLAASIFTQTSAQPSSASCASRATGVPPMAEIPPGRSTRNLHPAQHSHQQRNGDRWPPSQSTMTAYLGIIAFTLPVLDRITGPETARSE
jgi:hypothetical protein